MADSEVMQSDEKVLPIFYKKKVLSLKETKKLEEVMNELMNENEQSIANEELMLEKIRIKDNEFVRRLEMYLESFKNTNIQQVVLTSDMLPQWSPQKTESSKSSEDNLAKADDIVERLTEWYNAVDAYVSSQQEVAFEICSDWFAHMDKIGSEGETDPKGPEVDSNLVANDLEDSMKISDNTVGYIILILFCLALMFVFFKPEDIDQCSDGFINCFKLHIMKFCLFFHNRYLEFHNITLDYQSLTSEISSINDAV